MKQTVTYCSNGYELAMDLFLPNQAEYPGQRPGVLLFFGGGFFIGRKEQFHAQAEVLSRHGYVVMTPDYRVKTRQNAGPREGVADALAVWNFVRAHAEEWYLDSDRIALGGGSAGGYLALTTAILSEYSPKCLVLFNPAVQLEGEKVKERFGSDFSDLDPISHLRTGLPPMLIQHGEADTTVPLSLIREFMEQAESLGISCTLISYPGMQHGFFNKPDFNPRDGVVHQLKKPAGGVVNERGYCLTLQAMIRYLEKQL
jgi:acetyl esterase